jgi:16S rRNA (cytosine1402-N4)-methyltransferase
VEERAQHVPVLYEEVLVGLNIVPGGWYIDCTVGAGGHAAGILEASAPDGQLLGLDADPVALEICRDRLSSFRDRVALVHSNFARLREVAVDRDITAVDGILFDLGLSSMQLASPGRGFSFQVEGPLDMRFDPDTSRTAADLVNTLPESALADLIYRYGEEPASRAIARAIVAARPIRTTTAFAAVVSRAVGRRWAHSRHHPATRTFQALRIAVNGELENLEQGLADAVPLLKPGGRLAVIAFHSLEDRIVKRFFAREARDCICPPEAMVCTCDHQATVQLVNKKPIQPSRQEVQSNPPSRSAKLRIVSKL